MRTSASADTSSSPSNPSVHTTIVAAVTNSVTSTKEARRVGAQPPTARSNSRNQAGSWGASDRAEDPGATRGVGTRS